VPLFLKLEKMVVGKRYLFLMDKKIVIMHLYALDSCCFVVKVNKNASRGILQFLKKFRLFPINFKFY